MNYAKGKIAESLHVPEFVETVRLNGTKQFKKAEKSYPYLHQTLPSSKMTDKQRTKLLKKIKRWAEWLDNAVPYSPIPLGIDSILVSSCKKSIKRDVCVSSHLLKRECT